VPKNNNKSNGAESKNTSSLSPLYSFPHTALSSQTKQKFQQMQHQ